MKHCLCGSKWFSYKTHLFTFTLLHAEVVTTRLTYLQVTLTGQRTCKMSRKIWKTSRDGCNWSAGGIQKRCQFLLNNWVPMFKIAPLSPKLQSYSLPFHTAVLWMAAAASFTHDSWLTELSEVGQKHRPVAVPLCACTNLHAKTTTADKKKHEDKGLTFSREMPPAYNCRAWRFKLLSNVICIIWTVLSPHRSAQERKIISKHTKFNGF